MKSNYLKTKEGARLFSSLAEADPKSALETLKKTVGVWSKEELLEFTTGRREVVWALEKIAVWRELFLDAARILLALGEAENEKWSNNASGVFVELFSPGYGIVAPTEASPQERFPILKETLESDSKERRKLALRACSQALQTDSFIKMSGIGEQGLRKEPKLWMPKTWGELFDAYRLIWNFLCERVETLPEDEQQEVIDIILNHIRGIGRIQNLAHMVIDTIIELKDKPYVNRKKLLKTIISFLHYDGKKLPIETRQQWEKLMDELTGSDFPSLMRRYVGMDVFEDKFDENGKQVDQTLPHIKELAKQVIADDRLLLPELKWLVTNEAENGFRFGYELGKIDENFTFLPKLLEAQQQAGKNASAYFLSGYFRALFEKDRGKWEDGLDIIAKDKKLNVWVPELTLRGGISEKALLRILNLFKEGVIELGNLRMVGWAIRDISEDIVKDSIEFLISIPNAYAVSIALDWYESYYFRGNSKHKLPEELTLKILMCPSLFQKVEKGERDQMDDYHWTNIGKAFLKVYPQKGLEIAEKMLRHFGEEGTIMGRFMSETHTLLAEIAKLYPDEVWEKIVKYLGLPIDSRAFHIKEWLRGEGLWSEKNEGALSIFPLEKIWKWVDGDVEKRAWYLAIFVPKLLFRREGKICLAREILIRYGNRDDVQRNLIANFSTEGWTGPRSLHNQKKKQELIDFKKGENNKRVKNWIDRYIKVIDKEIEVSKIQEEREDF